MNYFTELVWNREFHFVRYGLGYKTLDAAIRAARECENMGDGAAVKKARVIDDTGKVVWAYGRLVP